MDEAHDYFRGLHRRIWQTLERLDGDKAVLRDPWQRAPGEALGGEGESCLLEGGRVFERAGVMFSRVEGKALPPSATARRPELAGEPFTAVGVSVVIHPRNPHVPTSHMNVRMLTAAGGAAWWFGGGWDLTPYYPVHEDVLLWHETAKRACDPFGAHVYPELKAACDEYFFLKHRGETRGVGGVFFDDLTEGSPLRVGDRAACFGLTRAIGDSFLEAYVPVVERRRDEPWGERERDFQLYRRGRYVEFNLVFDRGTHFGLQSGGRTEAILASMPPLAAWRYDWKPEAGTPEARLADYLRPRDWLAEASVRRQG
jgi:coproporphyrinogen III oxidase